MKKIITACLLTLSLGSISYAHELVTAVGYASGGVSFLTAVIGDNDQFATGYVVDYAKIAAVEDAKTKCPGGVAINNDWDVTEIVSFGIVDVSAVGVFTCLN